jgi:hypothetical protein
VIDQLSEWPAIGDPLQESGKHSATGTGARERRRPAVHQKGRQRRPFSVKKITQRPTLAPLNA